MSRMSRGSMWPSPLPSNCFWVCRNILIGCDCLRMEMAHSPLKSAEAHLDVAGAGKEGISFSTEIWWVLFDPFKVCLVRMVQVSFFLGRCCFIQKEVQFLLDMLGMVSALWLTLRICPQTMQVHLRLLFCQGLEKFMWTYCGLVVDLLWTCCGLVTPSTVRFSTLSTLFAFCRFCHCIGGVRGLRGAQLR